MKKKKRTTEEERKKVTIRHSTLLKIKKDKECKMCGSKKKLEFHHLSYDRNDNVITLCKKCHQTIMHKCVCPKCGSTHRRKVR